jgi:hypothetical protein
MLSYLLENPRRIKWKTLLIISTVALSKKLIVKICIGIKKELLNNMIDTANSLQCSGLKDDKVIFNLTLSQYPEPVEGFREYEKNWNLKDVRREDIT